MPEVEKTAGGRVNIRGIGEFEVGDQADVSEADARYLVEERGDFEYVGGEPAEIPDDEGDVIAEETVLPADEPPFDPSDHTVEEIEERLAEGAYGEPELLALYSAEREAEDRQTAVEAIEQAESELED